MRAADFAAMMERAKTCPLGRNNSGEETDMTGGSSTTSRDIRKMALLALVLAIGTALLYRDERRKRIRPAELEKPR